MAYEALAGELSRAADGALPYDVDAGAYRSAWHEATPRDRDRVDAVSPALGRALDDYVAALDEANAAVDAITARAGPLHWALPGLVEATGDDDGYRVVLSRHPTRDRTVIYDPVGRCVERFEDGVREATGPRALRSRMLGKALGQEPDYAGHIRRWDERHPGWHEVVWAWTRADDVPALLADRRDAVRTAEQAAGDAVDRLSRPDLAGYI